MKRLSNRLLKLAEFIVPGSFIADIGSDHCLLPIFLCEQNLIEGAFAVDNKEGPYSRMIKAIKDAGLEDIMYAFVGCLRGLTWGSWLVESIRDWCNDQLGENDLANPSKEEEEV